MFVRFSVSAGTISAEAKEHRNFERAFYVLLSEMVLRKAFIVKKKKIFSFRLPHPEGHLYSITQLLSSISTFISFLYSGARVVCAAAASGRGQQLRGRGCRT